MSPTALITDTNACLPAALANQYSIIQVPIMIQFGTQSLRAVEDIDNAATFARIDRDGKLPTTSAPAPGQFQQAFQHAFTAGYSDILCFTVSGEISATCASARTAAEMFPNRDIQVIDTHSLAIGEGFQVLAAARALAQGLSREQALAQAREVEARTHLFAALSTLKYLAMSGRVGQITAGLASMLDVRPILTIRAGKLDLLERSRTQQKAWNRVIELAAEAAAGQSIRQLALLHVNAEETARQFGSLLAARLPAPGETILTEITPGLSVHSGTGLVGVCFVCDN